MTQAQVYASWKPANGKVIGDGQCVSEVINNSDSYLEAAFPGVSWPSIISGVVGAKDLLSAAHPAYLEVIYNDHNDANQVPQQGDIMVFDATPESGYSNAYDNPYGHCGICEIADSNGFNLAQQNAPGFGQGFNVTHYGWKVRPCLGWLRLKLSGDDATPPTPSDGHVQVEINPGNWLVYTGAGKASSKLPGAAQGGQQYGPAYIMTNGWAQINYTGQMGYVEPAAYHTF